MRRILAFLVLFAAAPAQAQELYRLVAQVPLLHLADQGGEDVEALVKAYWPDHWQAAGELGFGRERLRAGRIDLDGDGRPELFLMIDQETWESEHGKPFVLARWIAGGWAPVGWGWGDEDSVFVTAERLGGWLSVDTPHHWLRWTGSGYDTAVKK